MSGPAKKQVYLFKEGNMHQATLLGGKGANLCEMTNLGLPVPPGFVISTEVCTAYFNSNRLPDGLEKEYLSALSQVEHLTGKRFGDPTNPLLVSVRSGAPISMPGMMDTVLSLGMNPTILYSLADQSGNPRWAYDTFRRFISMFASVVLGVEHRVLEELLTDLKRSRGFEHDTDIDVEGWKSLIDSYLQLVVIPWDPYEQLRMAIEAVFSSWNTPRARHYRQYHNIDDRLGTAVNIQAMVYGNMGVNSGTGVLFSRNPAQGDATRFGEFLYNAAGEDVVAGIRTPMDLEVFAQEKPHLHQELMNSVTLLEKHYKDMQDIEFTVEEGKLYILQCRNGKRTAKAALKIALDFMDEGLLSPEDALLRIDASSFLTLLHPVIDPKAPKTLLAKGLGASPGVVTGTLVFSSEEAEAMAAQGRKVILVRRETNADDVHGMKAACGVLTQFGGMTSHAAVVARGMGRCCVCGATEITVEDDLGTVTFPSGLVAERGHVVTLEGSTGHVYEGSVPTVAQDADASIFRMMDIAKMVVGQGSFQVRANADTPADAKYARCLGAEGIGLCRTEHMFFATDRVDIIRGLILSNDEQQRKNYLQQLFEFQRADLKEIFSAMSGYPVAIRLLDPPLHEFLPSNGDEQVLAHKLGLPVAQVERSCRMLREANPMLGLRGCRLGLRYPEITQMQVAAIVTGAIEAIKEGFHPEVEIMVPLVSCASELARLSMLIKEEVARTSADLGMAPLDYKLGTMLETPRACILADQLAPMASFFSFGTNDLTQMTFGFSRDDAHRFLPLYCKSRLLPGDPFVSLDTQGVGSLMTQAVDLVGRYQRGKSCEGSQKIEMGICGEQGGDPASVAFCVELGLNYTSCSPPLIPIARVSAAQAWLRKNRQDASE